MTDRELLQAIYGGVCGLQEDVTGLKQEVTELKQGMAELRQEVDVLKQDVADLKQEVDVLKQNVTDLNRRVTSIEMTLENETNKNIKVIAEGHLDLFRRLDEALQMEQEKEMMSLRVNVLENDMRIVKDVLGITA
ncbi:MAG: hypothetical protein ACI4FZ_11895 [Lachnospiraceae bacterium]